MHAKQWYYRSVKVGGSRVTILFPSTSPALQPIPVQVTANTQPRPWFNPWFIVTPQGACKVLQVVAGAGALTCILIINGSFWGTWIATGCAIVSFTCSLIALIMRMYNLIYLIPEIWLDVPSWEYLFVAAWTFAYGGSMGIMIYSAVFCLLGMISCAADFVVITRMKMQERSAGRESARDGRQNANNYKTSLA